MQYQKKNLQLICNNIGQHLFAWLHPHHPNIQQLILLQTQAGHGPEPYVSFLEKLREQLGYMLDSNSQTNLEIKTSKSLQSKLHKGRTTKVWSLLRDIHHIYSSHHNSRPPLKIMGFRKNHWNAIKQPILNSWQQRWNTGITTNDDKENWKPLEGFIPKMYENEGSRIRLCTW